MVAGSRARDLPVEFESLGSLQNEFLETFFSARDSYLILDQLRRSIE
jgi:hypothetical protein